MSPDGQTSETDETEAGKDGGVTGPHVSMGLADLFFDPDDPLHPDSAEDNEGEEEHCRKDGFRVGEAR